MNEPLFRESQRFGRPWMTISLFFLECSLIGLLALAIHQNKISGIENIIVPLFLSLIPAFLLIVTLITSLEVEITQTHIGFKWEPFQRSFRKIDLMEVKRMDVISFKFIGYGYRLSTRHGICHIVKGNKGVQIELSSGKKYLIGTQKEEQIKLVNAKIHENIDGL